MQTVVGPPLLVAAVAAAVLRLLGAIPGVVQPCPGPAAGPWDSVGAAEADLGVSLWVPAYLPPGAGRPAPRIRCLAASPLAVLVVIEQAEGPGAPVKLVQLLGAAPPAPAPAGAGAPTEEAPVRIDGGGVLRVLRGPDGRTWREVAWTRGGRHLTLRAPLETEEVLRIARSVGPAGGHEEGR